MSIPPRFLDEIRTRLTLSDVIGKRIKVTRAGREFKACCPFHKEKTPSFTINDDKQFYHCFGCGAHGDVIGFTMRHDNLSFIDAVEKLSAEAGLQMPKPDPEAVKQAQKSKGLHDLMDVTTSWFEEQLRMRTNNAVFEYMIGRGLSEETLSAFRVGYAPEDGQALRIFLKNEGFSDEQMLEAGVLKKSERNGSLYCFFRDRIMFPVADKRGRVVAFGGRILPDHMRPPERGDFKPPKYINSADTVLFDKGRMLYGEAQARQAAADGHSVIVTEGYMDVIAAHQAGFKGAVAPMGTALTEEQILSMWKMIPQDEKVPILSFDGDDAGRRAASRSCDRILPLLKPGQSVRLAFLPDGEDPDTLIRSGGSSAFRKVLEGAMSLFDFIWASHAAGRDFETPEARAGVVKTLEKQIAQIADADVQRHYKELLRARVSDSFFRRYKGKSTKKTAQALGIRRPAVNPSVIKEQIILASILNHPHIHEGLEEMIGHYNFSKDSHKALRQQIVSALSNDPTLDSSALKNHLKQIGFEQEMGDILSESVYVHAAFSSPRYDVEMVETKFREWISEIEQRDWTEIKDGWKSAFHSSNEDEEDRLRELIQVKASDHA
ncbi:MAG: DNA primase [Alphaproteobacteria bacterium]|nr:DNA primase [Alphaproteobacteria bacterium]